MSVFYHSIRRATRANGNSGGFTLAELLVAATLLSIVMTSVYTMTNTAMRSWRAVERGFDVHQEARNFMTLFSHEYNNIVGRAAHLFDGDDSSIEMFVVAQPLDLEQGEGPRLMRVSYSYNRSKRSIEREEALVEAALPLPVSGEEDLDPGRIKLSRRHKDTVANNVNRFSLQYVWAPTPQVISPFEPPIPEPLIFVKRHRQRLGLPQAVEITLEVFDPDDSERTYPMTLMLPIRAPSLRRPRELMEAALDGDY